MEYEKLVWEVILVNIEKHETVKLDVNGQVAGVDQRWEKEMKRRYRDTTFPEHTESLF